MIHHYNQTNKPKVKLKGIEYLLLSIQSHPGKSQRWHLKRLHMYQHGRPDFHKGGTNCGYFTSSSYRNVLWKDWAPKKVFYECFARVEEGRRLDYSYFSSRHGGPKFKYGGMKSSSAEMHLTMSGWNRANKVRAKLGLPYKTASFKDCSTM